MDLSTLLDEMRKKVDDRKLMLPEMGYLLKGSVVFLHQKSVLTLNMISFFIGVYPIIYTVIFINNLRI